MFRILDLHIALASTYVRLCALALKVFKHYVFSLFFFFCKSKTC